METWEQNPPLKLVFSEPKKPMVHCVDPEQFLAVYSKLYKQDVFIEYLPYVPRVQPIDWDADVCLDDQYRVHLGAWPHNAKEPKDSIIYESKDPSWIEYCENKLGFTVPDYIEEHKKVRIREW